MIIVPHTHATITGSKMQLLTRISRTAAHITLANRRWLKRQLIELAKEYEPKRILEIGSGKPEKGRYLYSMKSLFPGTDFHMTDIVPEYGHEVVDVTKMSYRKEFDLILCVSVLEHIVEPFLAAERIFEALRDGGAAFIATPFAYPLHDEPADYWRFTEHGLRLVLSPFSEISIRHRGPRKLPTGLLALAKR